MKKRKTDLIDHNERLIQIAGLVYFISLITNSRVILVISALVWVYGLVRLFQKSQGRFMKVFYCVLIFLILAVVGYVLYVSLPA